MALKLYNPFPSGFRLLNGSSFNRLFQGLDQFWALAVGGNVTVTGHVIASTASGITAHAGGGQANATLLTADFNDVTVVATLADSVKLPAATPGLSITVYNSAALSLQLFGSGTDTVNGAAFGTGVAVAAGHEASVTCYVAGAWVGPIALA